MTAEIRSTVPSFRSTFTPLSLSMRSACTDVHRSSQYSTVRPVRRSSLSANSRVCADCRLFVAAHMQRHPDQHLRDAVLAHERSESLDVVAHACSMERVEPLRGQPQFVADRQADALFAEIERQYAACARRPGVHVCHYKN